jgi:hypothetical protein
MPAWSPSLVQGDGALPLEAEERMGAFGVAQAARGAGRCARGRIRLLPVGEVDQPTFNGEYAVLLHTGAKLTLGPG